MNIKKCCCLLIPELSNKYIYFIIFLIASLLRKIIPEIFSNYIFNKYSSNKKDKDYNQLKVEKYVFIICNISSDLLTGFVHYIVTKNDKKIKSNCNDNNNNIDKNKEINNLRITLIYNDETQKPLLFHKIMLLLSLIDFTCQLCFYLSCHANINFIKNKEPIYDIDNLYSFLVIDIVSRYIFSRLILHTLFYCHHYFSFIINLIVLLMLIIIEAKYDIYKKYNCQFLILSFIQYVLYSLEDIINKVVLIKLYIYPESLLFYKGLYSLFYFFFFTLILKISGDLKIPFNFNINFLYGIIIRISFIVPNIVRSIYLVKFIDIFSSQHISFLKVSESIILFWYYYYFDSHSIKNKNFFCNIFEIIGCLILLISSLIHNEIIIINFNKLKEKTKYFLFIEAEIEKLKTEKSRLNSQ